MDTVLTHPLSPTQSSDFCIDTELSLALPAGNALRRTISLLSTCSLEQFSDTSVTSSPIANHQGAKEVDCWIFYCHDDAMCTAAKHTQGQKQCCCLKSSRIGKIQCPF